MGARLRREIEVPELGRVWTIKDAVISGHPREGHDLVQCQDAGWLWVHGGPGDVLPSSPASLIRCDAERQAQLPGRLQRLHTRGKYRADPVNYSVLFGKEPRITLSTSCHHPSRS